MDLDLTKVDDAKRYMSASVDREDWNSRCDAVKAANNGYPDFWGSEIRPILFGLFPDAEIRFREF